MRFRVFFDFKKSRNHLNEVQKFRDVLFLEKKGPCQECTTQESGVGMVTRIQISRYPDIQISRYQVSDTRYQVPEKRHKSQKNIFFPKVKNKFQRIARFEAMTP